VRISLALRMMAIVCVVSGFSTTLALLLQERSLSRDLERAARARLERAEGAAARLVDAHLAALGARYQAISGAPQFRANLEVGDAATLAHYAETLRERQAAARIAFLDPTDALVAGAGDAALDEAILRVRPPALVARGEQVLAVASVPLVAGVPLGASVPLVASVPLGAGEAIGRLVAAEPVGEARLAEWSALVGVAVRFSPREAREEGALEAVVRELGELELRVASPLEAERQALRRARGNLVLAGAIALAVALLGGHAAARRLVSPIERLKAAATRIGAGDLTVRLEIDRRDEIGDVARAFDEMGAALRATLGDVTNAADRLESTAGQVASLAEGVTHAAADQAESNQRIAESMSLVSRQLRQLGGAAAGSQHALDQAVDGSSSSVRGLRGAGEELDQNATLLLGRVVEIAQAIDEMIGSARQVADSTRSLSSAAEQTSRSMTDMTDAMQSVDRHLGETKSLSQRVIDAAERGRQQVRVTTDGLEAIHAASTTAEETIRELARQAEAIGQIVDVIDGVAEDSSLLALNAAIIAAQAGERGRAFAVVADEIGEFAGRVRASTKQIAELVERVQRGTTQACTAVERGAQSVRQGVEMAAEAGDALVAILEAANESGARNAQVVTATAAQSVALQRVAEQMERVRQGVDRIEHAGAAQQALHDAVRRSSQAVSAAAGEVRVATDRQGHDMERIGESVETVRVTVQQMRQALEDQLSSIRGAGELLDQSHGSIALTGESAERIDVAMRDLRAQAEQLRMGVRKFRT
jgi:methyl-accepting chemotaxis protein